MAVELSLRVRRPLGGDVEQLLFVPESPLEYEAGQFLELLIPGERDLYFTIANAPADTVELHVDTAPANVGAITVLDRVEHEGTVLAEVGGDTHVGRLPQDTSPVLLIASATGFSQIKAVAEALFEQAPRPIHIYWAVRSARGLYMAELAQGWSDTHEHVHFTAVISERQTWDSGQHHLHACISEDLPDLSEFSAICCGSPDMVYATLDYLREYKLPEERFFSDMLTFAPRP